jgi:hypothetical protein
MLKYKTRDSTQAIMRYPGGVYDNSADGGSGFGLIRGTVRDKSQVQITGYRGARQSLGETFCPQDYTQSKDIQMMKRTWQISGSSPVI